MTQPTDGRPQAGALAQFVQSYPLRIAAYYAALLAAGLVAWPILPRPIREELSQALSGGRPAAVPDAGADPTRELVPSVASMPLVAEVAFATLGAFLLALPVAWIYMFTRRRKGYQQSVVHSLLMLPTIVAGVVELVRTSLALAFGLAGIVAAVRFRNALDDSRDAVFIFFATVLGLAAAVELDVAVFLSIAFNALVLALYYADFGRIPPPLEGVRAQRSLERATAISNRTSQFVALVDREVLSDLAPQQLDALAERLRERREETGSDLASPALAWYGGRLRVRVTDPEAARAVLEPVLEAEVKRWAFIALAARGDGVEELEYAVKLRKRVRAATLLSVVRDRGQPYVVDAAYE